MTAARYIPADATPFERYRIGDTVAHITLGDGHVIGNNGAYIVVEYPNTKTGRVIGEYDARWFHLHPRFLFHRGEITPGT